MTIRVVVADDHWVARDAISAILGAEDDFQVVASVEDGRAAVEEARLERADVVVMDIRMPVLDGIEATRALTSDSSVPDQDHLIKVLVLTTFDDDESVFAALQCGASGFLLKSGVPQDLVRAVRAVANGGGWLEPSVVDRVMRRLAQTPRSKHAAPELIARLTARERTVLSLMANGLSNGEICAKLVLSEATVKTHVGRILTKTGSRDRTQAVILAYQSGLIVP